MDTGDTQSMAFLGNSPYVFQERVNLPKLQAIVPMRYYACSAASSDITLHGTLRVDRGLTAQHAVDAILL